MIFSYFTNVASPGIVCRKPDWERLTHDSHVAQLIADFRAGNDTAKRNLPAVCWHAFFPSGRRKSKEAQPSGAILVDFDHMSEEILKLVSSHAIPPEDQAAQTPILLVHITPSGKGLRVVFKATKNGIFATCQSIADYQMAMAKYLHAEEYLDTVCTDLARLSFVPQAQDVLYLNDRLFTDTAEVTEFAESHTEQQYVTPVPANPELFPNEQDSFDGIPLKDIFAQYIGLTGGMPQQGARNTRYYSAARDLRYICDFNPRVLAANLPDCGLTASELFQLCNSACQSTRGSQPPSTVLKAINICSAIQSVEQEEEKMSELEEGSQFDPAILPPLVKEFIYCAPPDFKEATLLSLLPIVGTLSTHLRAYYLDGEEHSTSFFTTVISPQASGKSFARRLVMRLLNTIEQEDAQARAIENEYNEARRLCKDTKNMPADPKAKIRIVPASISIAKLLKRMDNAQGEHLFTFAEEVDTLIKANKGGAWSQKNDMYRNAFDNALYGQDFISDNSYSANCQVFYNLLVLGTPCQAENFFNDVENGLVSRCCLATIPDQFGSRRPQWKQMDNNIKLLIEEYVRKIREARGIVDLDFLFPALDEWLENHRILALLENDRAHDIFRRRSAVIGFRAVLCFAPLYDLSLSSSKESLSKFAVLVADLVLNNQMKFAGEKLNKILVDGMQMVTKTKSDAIYNALPEHFTPAELSTQLRKRGMTSQPRQIIWKWVKNNLVKKIDRNLYSKIFKK